MLVQAAPGALEKLHNILRDRSEWIHEQGIDLFHKPYPKDFLYSDLMAQRVWAWEQEEMLLGLIRILEEPPSYYPPGVWADDEQAWYLAQLAVDPAFKGRRIGEQILDAVEVMARDQEILWLRGNIILPNKKLVQYYQHQGFDMILDQACFNEDRGVERRYGFMEKRVG